MQRPNSLLSLVLILILLAGVFIGAFFFADYILDIPSKAEAVFGAPSPSISPFQQIKLSWQLLQSQDILTIPSSNSDGEFLLIIESGESPITVIERLGQAGLINDEEVFRKYLIYKGYDSRIQSGEFRIQHSLSPIQIAEVLLDSTSADVIFSILPGWRLEEIAASLPTSGLNILIDDFILLAKNPPPTFSYTPGLANGTSLEGFLLPGQYDIPRSADALTLIVLLSEHYNQSVGDDLLQAIADQEMTLLEATTIASIIERETVVQDESPLIASVFLNRLTTNMKLEADPTVQYALGFNSVQNTWWTNPLTLEDLDTNSPYNTYKYTGLPPGPISSPSLTSLQAVANPANTNYYYFRAKCDGSGRHEFAETFSDHQSNSCP
jgi:UPF0755 protein